MWLNASCTLEFKIPVPTPFIFILRPRSGFQQWICSEEYYSSPSTPAIEFTDSFGNLCQRLIAPAGDFSVRTRFYAETAEYSDTGFGAPFIEVQNLPSETLPFLYPSRYCESDRFTQMSASLVNGQLPGYNQCIAIVDYIRDTFNYTPEDGETILSATEVNQLRNIVCRDMAHLGIACCRALSIPARLVVGYLETLDPMDLHAWFEAYVGNRWYAFDPTQKDMQGGRIAIAYGRDAADVAIYTQFGDPVELHNMQVKVEKMPKPPEPDF